MGLLSYDASPNYLLLRGSFTDRGMAQLQDLAGLFALNLDASELHISAAGLAPLVGLPHLGWLAVDANDASMPYIARMPRLRFLGCQDTVASDEGFMALSQSPSIEYIWGRRCHNLQTKGFAALAGMPALRGPAVSCKNVADSGVAALPRFPALRELMPMDIPEEGYRHIARCEGLESLILMLPRHRRCCDGTPDSLATTQKLFRQLHTDHRPHARTLVANGFTGKHHVQRLRWRDQHRPGTPGSASAPAGITSVRTSDHPGDYKGIFP